MKSIQLIVDFYKHTPAVHVCVAHIHIVWDTHKLLPTIILPGKGGQAEGMALWKEVVSRNDGDRCLRVDMFISLPSYISLPRACLLCHPV